MYKDVSLTGGTTISLFTEIDSKVIELELAKEIQNLEVRTLMDNTGKQTQIVIIVSEEKTDLAIELVESFLGYKLDTNNSSIETSSATLSSNFYKQLLSSIALAFFWMSAVVFLIFGSGKKLKFLIIFLNVLLGILLGKAMVGSFSALKMILILILGASSFYIYIKNSIPSFAVILSAFSDLVMTLAVVNLIGMRLSTAGIVAFLMMIGYSVDTDILLTTRVLRRKHSINREMFDAFKTGLTMTLTSIVAVATALIVVYNFQSVLNQIFTILLIGLSFDLLNTWLANASIIKWYAEAKK
jgi:preprotein translocase subunit SecF